MEPIISWNYCDFETEIDRAYSRICGDRDRTRMVGLLFAREDSELAKSALGPGRPYFHVRSGESIDFFWIGWGRYFDETPGPPTAGERTGWYFDNRGFVESTKLIEDRTKWQYSGGTDLLLANVRKREGGAKAEIDYTTVIVCQLERMLRQGAIPAVDIFFEQIFRFAESYDGYDPTWGFSDSVGRTIGASALLRIVLSLLPNTIGADARRIAHFGIRDVAKRP